MSRGDPHVAAELVLSYSSWVNFGLGPSGSTLGGSGPSEERRALEASFDDGTLKPLIDLLPDTQTGPERPVIAVVRDIRVLGQLLAAHDLGELVTAHVGWIERRYGSAKADVWHRRR